MIPRRCDSHHHLFARPSPFLGGASYGPADFATDAAEVDGIVSSVYVQARNAYDETAPAAFEPVGETRWVAGLPGVGPLVSRIVGHADLRRGPDVAPVLDAHVEAGRGRFAGIRHTASWTDDPAVVGHAGGENRPGLMLDPRYREGLRAVQARGLTFETWIFQHQLGEFADLAAACDDGPMILDHLGGPLDPGPGRERRLDTWEAGMAALVPLRHVHVKISGLGIPVLARPDRFSLPAAAESIARHWSRPVRWCLEHLGPERCLAGSDFPVDAWLCSYKTLWDAIDLLLEDLSEPERQQVLCDTAERVYGVVRVGSGGGVA